MKKQVIILFILFFSACFFPLFCFASSSVIADEGQYPKITSISPTTVSLGQDFEIIGEHLNNTLWYTDRLASEPVVGDKIIFRQTESGGPLWDAACYAEIISWTDNKIVAKLVGDGNDNGATYSVRLSFINKDGGADVVASPFFTVKAETNCAWECSEWTYPACPKSGINAKTRTCVKPAGCESLTTPMPATTSGNIVPCVPSNPVCTLDDWSCTEWSSCSIYSTQTRNCSKKIACDNTQTDPTQTPVTSQSCSWCDKDIWSCYDWTNCSPSGSQSRTCIKAFDCPTDNTSSPATTQSCVYTPPCTEDTWSCGDWTACSSYGSQTRVCNKTNDCSNVYTPSPVTSQNCTPPCNADTWTCDSWGACSLSGIQSRNCTKTFDCPNIQTAPPITDQFCEASNRPQQTAPSESEEITNQDTIIKATIKLLCPVDEQKASQGSGTMIDSAGTILTNKHVIAGTLGCLVGFIDNFSDEPYFGDRQIADIVKVSSNQDIAVLKIRNPKNNKLPYVDTSKGSVNFALGTKITTYGYPAKFGTKVTYTSGDFSGTDGGYIKTTAILEYGNSGGGAYLKNGTYIGIPSAVVKGELNAMGYILSINTIRAWLNNSSVASGDTNNNYSRVSVLEDIDLKKLGSLKLFIPNVDKNSNLVTPTTNQNTQKTTDQTQVAPQQESVVIESNNSNKENALKQNTSSTQNVSSTPWQQPQKISLIKRFFLWLSNLFSRLATR